MRKIMIGKTPVDNLKWIDIDIIINMLYIKKNDPDLN